MGGNDSPSDQEGRKRYCMGNEHWNQAKKDADGSSSSVWLKQQVKALRKKSDFSSSSLRLKILVFKLLILNL